MDVGRAQDNLWTWQWQTVHNTLKTLLYITSGAALPAAAEDEEYGFDFTALGGTPGYTWAQSAGALPPGLALTGNRLAGIPTAAGTFNFTLRATDTSSITTTQAFTLAVVNANSAPVFTEDPFTAPATEDSAFTGAITATDADAGDTLTYTKISGPDWLTVSPSGALSGTPDNGNIGANNFVVRVTDVGGLYDEAALTITVAKLVITYDQWAAAKGLGSANNGKNQDPDGDGMVNLMEYALGLDPTVGDVNPILFDQTSIDANTFLRLSVTRDPTVTDVLIEGLSAGTLLDSNAWSTATTVIESNTPSFFRVRDALPIETNSQRFLKLRFSLP
jgi:hypothetical protein